MKPEALDMAAGLLAVAGLHCECVANPKAQALPGAVVHLAYGRHHGVVRRYAGQIGGCGY